MLLNQPLLNQARNIKFSFITNIFGLFLGINFLVLSSCCSTNKLSSATVKDSTQTKEEVRMVIAAERKAWAARNAEEATKNYTDDIYWINAFGIVKRGKDESQNFITKIFKKASFLAGKPDKEDVVSDIRLLSNDIAWAHSYGESSGQLTDSGQLMAKRKTHIFYILSKVNNNWLIKFFQVMDEKQ